MVRRAHAWGSSRTALKEAAKSALALLGNAKYAMHAPNDVLRPVTLRDGAPVLEFLRGNPYWAAVDGGDTATGLADVLTVPMLETLVAREGVMILYTHLGKVTSREIPLPEPTCAAFRLLAREQDGGRVLVTTTRRALDYCALRRGLSFTTREEGGGTVIDIIPPPGLEPHGVTFYVRDPSRTELCVRGVQVRGVRGNPKDHTGRPSVSLPWPSLTFPAW